MMSCLLSGCDTTSNIALADFFTLKQDYSHVLIDEEDQSDYGHVIGDILSKYASNASRQLFYSKENTNPWMTYSFHAHKDDFTSFKVYFYPNGKINTYCLKDTFMNRTEQNSTYTVSEEAFKQLQEEVSTRVNEIKEIFAKEKAKAKEYATPNKFFELLENPKDGFKPCVDTYLDNSNQSKRFSNITPELIQDLKNLDYKEVGGANVPEEFSYIEIRASDDWQLTIYKNVPYASSYYIYDNTLTITSLSVVYSINEEMRSALVNRCQEMIENNTYYK